MSQCCSPAASHAVEEVPLEGSALRERVAERYGAIAQGVLDQGAGRCCAPGASETSDSISTGIYAPDQTGEVPEAALAASLGCGNPTALAELSEGEVVLDLGSGGGIDVLLSARRVGPRGFAYGLDMTGEMLELARRNRQEAGVDNVEFLAGHIEAIPLPDASIDVIISNCVINLSADKRQVFREAYRVLKPGGRFAVSDIVLTSDLGPTQRRDLESWVGCVAGALEESEYRDGLEEAGFAAITIAPIRDVETELGRVFSAFIRAVKPEAAG